LLLNPVALRKFLFLPALDLQAARKRLKRVVNLLPAAVLNNPTREGLIITHPTLLRKALRLRNVSSRA
jgi:hypothetical protein